MKKYNYILMMFGMLIFLFGCSSAALSVSSVASIPQDSSISTTQMNSSELALYNGQNGQPTYVAYKGIVYDVSNHSQWRNGAHKGMQLGGTDITSTFPHPISYLSSLPIVAQFSNSQLSTISSSTNQSLNSLLSSNHEDEDEDDEDDEDEDDDDNYYYSSSISSGSTASNSSSLVSLQLTLSDLAQFNGLNGQPTYVAFNGIIYDVSNHSLWKNGVHKGMNLGGKDITVNFPHSTSYFQGVPIVGNLIN